MEKLGQILKQSAYSLYELIVTLWNKQNDSIDSINYLETNKTSLNGDHKGTWQGYTPSQVDIALNSIIDSHTNQIKDIELILRPTGNDDTNLINDAINIVSSNTRIKKVVLDGIFNVSAPSPFMPAINIRSNMILEFTEGSKIVLLPNNFDGSYIIDCKEVDNFTIINPHLVGDRDTHTGTSGEWGHGLNIRGCSNYKVYNLVIEKCWGDGLVISNSNAIISKNGYINSVKASYCRRNGVTIASADGLRIDSIYGEYINGTAPFAALDIESNDSNEVWKNIKIGSIKSYLCPGGMFIQPYNIGGYTYTSEIDITIDEIKIIGNDTSDTGKLTFDGFTNKVTGSIKINKVFVNKSNRSIIINGIDNGGVSLYIGLLDIITSKTGDTVDLNNRCGIFITGGVRDSKNIGDIYFDKVKFRGDAEYFANLLAQNSGTIEKSNFKIGQILGKINVPMRIDGTIHDFTNNIENEEVNVLSLAATYNPGANWFGNHFLSTKYVNDGATSNQYVSPSGSGFNLRETPITVENRVNGFYLEVDTGNNPIYPASLGFTNGFKSSTIGSKITFIQKSNGTVWVINKVGDWITA
jgi:hypothetical protein